MSVRLSLVAPALLLACATGAGAENRILPESLNIEVVEGTTIMPACEIAVMPEAVDQFRLPHAQCVELPSDRAGAVQQAYFRRIRQAGWTPASGAANAAYFQRPAEQANCFWRLDFAGFPKEAPPSPNNWQTPNMVFVFGVRPEPVCEAQP